MELNNEQRFIKYFLVKHPGMEIGCGQYFIERDIWNAALRSKPPIAQAKLSETRQSGILSFEKPKKIRETEEHNDLYSSDSGIDGTYVPNMSREDVAKWKAKITGVKTIPQVEIRKDSFVIVVGLDGYDYKYYKRNPQNHLRGCSTEGLNIHIASAGPIHSREARLRLNVRCLWEGLRIGRLL